MSGCIIIITTITFITIAITIIKVITAGLVVGEVPGDEVALEVAPLQLLIAPPRTVETPDQEEDNDND